MKRKMKFIIPAAVVAILIAVVVFLLVPQNILRTSGISNSPGISVVVVQHRTVQGSSHPQSNSAVFALYDYDPQFTQIIDLLEQYSTRRSVVRSFSENWFRPRHFYNHFTMVTLTGTNGQIILTNTSYANVRINGTMRRMGMEQITALIYSIMEIGGVDFDE